MRSVALSCFPCRIASRPSAPCRAEPVEHGRAARGMRCAFPGCRGACNSARGERRGWKSCKDCFSPSGKGRCGGGRGSARRDGRGRLACRFMSPNEVIATAAPLPAAHHTELLAECKNRTGSEWSQPPLPALPSLRASAMTELVIVPSGRPGHSISYLWA